VLGTNLLPGRSMVSHLYPLTTAERPCTECEGLNFTPQSPLPWPAVPSPLGMERWPAADLLTRLVWGELPGIVSADEAVRGELLRAYSMVYLAEELRREALVKDWVAF